MQKYEVLSCVGKELLKALLLGRRHDDTVFITVLRLPRLVSQEVTACRLIEHCLATTCDADALLRPAVRLELHEMITM